MLLLILLLLLLLLQRSPCSMALGVAMHWQCLTSACYLHHTAKTGPRALVAQGTTTIT